MVQMVEDTGSEEPSAMVRGGEEELLPCPICFKTCSSRLELDAHMDTHPDTALRYEDTWLKTYIHIKGTELLRGFSSTMQTRPLM